MISEQLIIVLLNTISQLAIPVADLIKFLSDHGADDAQCGKIEQGYTALLAEVHAAAHPSSRP